MVTGNVSKQILFIFAAMVAMTVFSTPVFAQGADEDYLYLTPFGVNKFGRQISKDFCEEFGRVQRLSDLYTILRKRGSSANRHMATPDEMNMLRRTKVKMACANGYISIKYSKTVLHFRLRAFNQKSKMSPPETQIEINGEVFRFSANDDVQSANYRKKLRKVLLPENGRKSALMLLFGGEDAFAEPVTITLVVGGIVVGIVTDYIQRQAEKAIKEELEVEAGELMAATLAAMPAGIARLKELCGPYVAVTGPTSDIGVCQKIKDGPVKTKESIQKRAKEFEPHVGKVNPDELTSSKTANKLLAKTGDVYKKGEQYYDEAWEYGKKVLRYGKRVGEMALGGTGFGWAVKAAKAGTSVASVGIEYMNKDITQNTMMGMCFPDKEKYKVVDQKPGDSKQGADSAHQQEGQHQQTQQHASSHEKARGDFKKNTKDCHPKETITNKVMDFLGFGDNGAS